MDFAFSLRVLLTCVPGTLVPSASLLSSTQPSEGLTLTLRIMLLLLLSHFSRVRLCATPSLGFSRQEHWSGVPFPSPVHKSEVKVKLLSRVRLSDTRDCSLPGSSVHGILQARVLEWGAIAFSVPNP